MPEDIDFRRDKLRKRLWDVPFVDLLEQMWKLTMRPKTLVVEAILENATDDEVDTMLATFEEEKETV